MCSDTSEDVKGHFGYFQWSDKFDNEKPYYLYMDPPKGFPVSNFSTQLGPAEQVHDLSRTTKKFNLDDHGFMVAKQDLRFSKFDQDTVENHYLPSLEKLIRNSIDQDAEIVWFDWRTRSSNHEDHASAKLPRGTKLHLDDRSIDLPPAKAVHVGADPLATALLSIDKTKLKASLQINLRQQPSIESAATHRKGQTKSSRGGLVKRVEAVRRPS
ncbi:hypothetical protein FDECE_10835 [Fusarium decemcellulare]|nr:hypothetical protein FDECE_10835 [Fusarium decemcellulare]